VAVKAAWTVVLTCFALLAPVSVVNAEAAPSALGAADRYEVAVSLNGPDGAVIPGKRVILTGDIVGLRQGKKNWGAHVVVRLAMRSGGEWTTVKKQTVYTGGPVRGSNPFTLSTRVEQSQTFRAVLRATPRRERAVSEPERVTVAGVMVSASRDRVSQGRPITVSARCGAVCAGKRATLQKRVAGEWKFFARTHLNDRGRHDFTWKTATVGDYRMRVVVGHRWDVSDTVEFDVTR
jgi:hypothetical protein